MCELNPLAFVRQIDPLQIPTNPPGTCTIAHAMEKVHRKLLLSPVSFHSRGFPAASATTSALGAFQVTPATGSDLRVTHLCLLLEMGFVHTSTSQALRL